MLRPLRPVAEEIVVAADSRVGKDDLACYAGVADRLLRFEYSPPIERALPWLYGQCRGDWILRLDGDEVLPPAFIRALPRLLEARNVRQYYLPRRWLFPDEGHWLAEWPWEPDHQNRLVRNDPVLWLPGLDQSGVDPALPARYLETPVYHLSSVLLTHADRAAKVSAYLAIAPELKAPGGDEELPAFFLPEDHHRLEPLPVPEEDADAIRTVLSAPAEPRPIPDELPVAHREEVDAYWPERQLSPRAYEASIEPAVSYRHRTAGAHSIVHVRVRNGGDECWPGGQRQPLIQVAYRWLSDDGTVVVPEGIRTAFPCAVRPGEDCLVPAVVAAPETPGRYVLEIDLVHEFVRWFGAITRVEMTVHR
jgi:hypothetical protein